MAKKNNIKTEWNLALLYPKGDADPQIEKDMQAAEAAYAEFAAKYEKNDSYTKDAAALLTALSDLETLNNKANNRPLMYYHYKQVLNSADKHASAMMTTFTQRFTTAGNTIVFFSLTLGKIAPEKQAEFLANAALARYHHFLRVMFNESKHRIGIEGERVLNLMSLPANQLWTKHVQEKTTALHVVWKGKKMPLSQARGLVSELPTKERRALYALIVEAEKSIAADAEAELNALGAYKKITDELRGFSKPFDSRVLDSQNRTETIERMIKVVESHNSISHRFYKIKAKLLKEKKLTYADRSAAVGSTSKKYSFAETCGFLSETFGKISPFYRETFEEYLAKGQIDAFPRKGKAAGAFCSSSTNNPIFVLLNHVDTFKSVNVLAHEMGHAFHSEWTERSQPNIYHDYSTPVAEVASTFFENFAFDALLETLTPKERVIALHDKINGSVATIFRQIALFKFENELHLSIRRKGALTHDEMAALLAKHMQEYLGPSVKVSKDDGYDFVTWTHIRLLFYVYAYAYGEMVSTALYARYKKDPAFLAKVEEFMKAGSSKSSEAIFEDIGIPVSSEGFFKEALDEISREVDLLDKSVKEILKK